MKSKKRSTVAVLREILGEVGSEDGFGALTGLSLSWIKKASAKSIPMSIKAAKTISEATGVSPDWLLLGDPLSHPVEVDNTTLYTSASYERWRLKRSSISLNHAGVAAAILALIPSLVAAKEADEGPNAVADFMDAVRSINRRYGKNTNKAACDKLLHHITRDLGSLSKLKVTPGAIEATTKGFRFWIGPGGIS